MKEIDLTAIAKVTEYQEKLKKKKKNSLTTACGIYDPAAITETTATTNTKTATKSSNNKLNKRPSEGIIIANTTAVVGTAAAGAAAAKTTSGKATSTTITKSKRIPTCTTLSSCHNSSSTSTMASSNHRGGGGGGAIQIGSAWFQRKINLRPQHRGVHLVTEEILRQMPELGQFSVGLCHVQILHTSASLALNESWDPDVRDDMEMMLNKIVPEGLPYRHSCEGPDDMPAHVKACFLGSSLTIPITDGKLSLGTWQGVWLCEHRDQAGSRKLVITLTGCPRESARSPLSPVSPIASTSS